MGVQIHKMLFKTNLYCYMDILSSDWIKINSGLYIVKPYFTHSSYVQSIIQ